MTCPGTSTRRSTSSPTGRPTYTSGEQYWFDTQANTTRTARDYAERLHPEEVWAEVVRRLQDHRTPAANGFAAVHVAPESSADVPDGQEARLVIVPPAHVHERRQGADSPAYRWSLEVLERRGSGARTHRNMLVFLAADAARYEELQASIREYLAWKYVRDNADGVLNLAAQQRQQAVERLDRADRTGKIGYSGLPLGVGSSTARPGPDPCSWNRSKQKAARTTWPCELPPGSSRSPNSFCAAPQPRSGSTRHHPRDGLRPRRPTSASGPCGTTTPPTPTWRGCDRKVLEAGVLSTLDTPIDWQHQGFALADDWDGSRYTGLVLPTDPDGTSPATVDSLLLVQPRRAEEQRDREGTPPPGRDPVPDRTRHRAGSGPNPPPGPARIAATAAAELTRYFGTVKLNPDFYARDWQDHQRGHPAPQPPWMACSWKSDWRSRRWPTRDSTSLRSAQSERTLRPSSSSSRRSKPSKRLAQGKRGNQRLKDPDQCPAEISLNSRWSDSTTTIGSRALDVGTSQDSR